MSLKDRTRELDTAEMAALNIEDLKLIQQADREVIGGGLYETAVSAGNAAPGFSLLNQDEQSIALSDLLGAGPLVLSFNRGSWCGYCRLELVALEQARSTFTKKGAQIVSIAPQSINANRELHDQLDLGFPTLSDPGARVASLYGLAYKLPEDLRHIYDRTGPDLASLNAAKGEKAWMIPVPATYLISQDGQVDYTFFDANYRNRLDPQELIEALAAH